MVTGGSGFLVTRIVQRLCAKGAPETFVRRSRDYDLRNRAAFDQALADGRSDVVSHASAVVGGMRANETHPGSFFYDNAIMGIQLIEACRAAGVEKVVTIGTVCS